MPLRGRRIGLLLGLIGTVKKDIPRMQLSNAVPVRTAVFNEPILVSRAGLVPAMGLGHSPPGGRPSVVSSAAAACSVRNRELLGGERGRQRSACGDADAGVWHSAAHTRRDVS